MESIPSNVQQVNMQKIADHQSNNRSNNIVGSIVSDYNKYGTISACTSRIANLADVLGTKDDSGDKSNHVIINNRLRAINRSFRTAVDKSFDMVNSNSNSNGKYQLIS